MNKRAQQVSDENVSSEQVSGEKLSAEQADTANPPGGKWLALLFVILLIVVIAYNWYAISNQPTRILARAITYLENEQFDELNLELTKLEGLPEYELHRKVLRGAMFVKQQRYSDADELFEYLPADERLRLIGFLHEGIARFHQQRLQEAISDFQQSLEIAPDNRDAREWLAKAREQLKPHWVLERGRQSLELGDWKSFEELAESLRNQEDAQPYYHFMMGLVQLNQGDVPQAIESFNKSQAEPALREDSLLTMAGAYASLGMYPDAEVKYLQTLEHNDDCIPAHTWLAAWYHDQGAINFATVHLRKLVELQPDNPRPSRMLGLSALEMRDYKQAIEDYREALKRPHLAPHVRDEVLVEIADCLVHERDYDAALKALNDEALNDIAADPLKVQRDVLLAECYSAETNTTLALEHLDRALAISATDLSALIAKGSIRQVEGNLDEAIEIFEKAVKHHPRDYTAKFKLSQALLQNADNEGSKKHADLAETIKKLYDRKTELNLQAAGDPSNSEVRYQLGLVALELDDPNLAGFWFNSAVTVDPSNLLAKAALAKLREHPPEQQPDKEHAVAPQEKKDKLNETKTEQSQE